MLVVLLAAGFFRELIEAITIFLVDTASHRTAATDSKVVVPRGDPRDLLQTISQSEFLDELKVKRRTWLVVNAVDKSDLRTLDLGQFFEELVVFRVGKHSGTSRFILVLVWLGLGGFGSHHAWLLLLFHLKLVGWDFGIEGQRILHCFCPP